MASTSKAFKKCVDPCPRYLTPDDTHDLCVFCLGEEHARDVLEGEICVHCELFSMKNLCSRLSLFSRKEGQPSASRDSGPTAAEARRQIKLWGSQLDLELERDLPFYRANESELLDCDDVISLTSSDPAACALLGYAQEEQGMFEGEEVETEPCQSSCPAYEELLEVMERPRWWRHGDVSMSGTFLAITTQLKWAFHFFLISIRRLRRNGKSRFPLASVDSSIPVMLTS